ncbi:MAG: NADH-quinone oxidoreductase subunit M, partial [Nitrospirae bacterium]|nr:NADH-quinone oxidoreductase subunit M [Nitrospirota bacterium]
MSDVILQTGGFPWLTTIVFLPLAGALLLMLVNKTAHHTIRWIALAVSIFDLVLSLPLWSLFDPATSRMQFVEHVAWMVSPPITYSVGVDGISLPLVLLTAFLTP